MTNKDVVPSGDQSEPSPTKAAIAQGPEDLAPDQQDNGSVQSKKDCEDVSPASGSASDNSPGGKSCSPEGQELYDQISVTSDDNDKNIVTATSNVGAVPEVKGLDCNISNVDTELSGDKGSQLSVHEIPLCNGHDDAQKLNLNGSENGNNDECDQHVGINKNSQNSASPARPHLHNGDERDGSELDQTRPLKVKGFKSGLKFLWWKDRNGTPKKSPSKDKNAHPLEMQELVKQEKVDVNKVCGPEKVEKDPILSKGGADTGDMDGLLSGSTPSANQTAAANSHAVGNLEDVSLKNVENGGVTFSKDVVEIESRLKAESCCSAGPRRWFTLLVLTFIALATFMDRYVCAGVLSQIIKYYGINNSDAGLLQTSFILSYMILSPLFGFMGDRYNRKLIMACGIFFWSAVTLAGSFVPSNHFWLFLLLRAAVGIGEASYSTIAPTIIADLFSKDLRTKALAVFYFAIPVGSGLGYIVGSKVAAAMGAWQWGLRVTPALGVVCVLLILTVVKEPPRGASEGGTHLGQTSWKNDILYLLKNKSFVLSSLGFTCVAFVAGALSLWAPVYIEQAILIQQGYEASDSVALKFGIITCAAGILGVGLGSESARRLRKKYLRADPLVCAFGLLSSAPFLYLAIVLSNHNTPLTWGLIFIGETLLCLNWAIVTDIVLYVVIPTRRSTAEAFQILLSHALGDAGSPYIIGAMSVKLSGCTTDVCIPSKNFPSLQYAMYTACFVCVLGGGFFLATALFIVEDKAKAEKTIKEEVMAALASIHLKSLGHRLKGGLSQFKQPNGTIPVVPPGTTMIEDSSEVPSPESNHITDSLDSIPQPRILSTIA